MPAGTRRQRARHQIFASRFEAVGLIAVKRKRGRVSLETLPLSVRLSADNRSRISVGKPWNVCPLWNRSAVQVFSLSWTKRQLEIADFTLKTFQVLIRRRCLVVGFRTSTRAFTFATFPTSASTEATVTATSRTAALSTRSTAEHSTLGHLKRLALHFLELLTLR